jgi:hypothetical protein
MDVKTVLLLGHLAGLTLGLGAVSLMDLYLMRLLRGDLVTRADADLIALGSRSAALGLGLLWLTGLGFLLLYLNRDPEMLANPKLHAKMAIVIILTANGVLLHKCVLPRLKRNIGRPLFGPLAPAGVRLVLRAAAALSAASWWTPFFLGAVKELNFAAPIWAILGGYMLVAILIYAALATLEQRSLINFSRPPRQNQFQTLEASLAHTHASQACASNRPESASVAAS